MPPETALGQLVAALIALPFVLFRDLIWRPLLWLNRYRLRRADLPPTILNRSRAVGAAGLAGFSVDIALHLPLLTGDSFGELLAMFLRSHVLSPVLAILLAAFALSLLLLIVGLTRGGRSALRDPIAALLALSIAAGAGWLLWQQYEVPAEFVEFSGTKAAQCINTLVHALYVSTLSAALMRAWLSAPLIGGNALRRILRHIQQRTGRLRPARRRSY